MCLADTYKAKIDDGREVEVKKTISFVIKHNGVVLLKGKACDEYGCCELDGDDGFYSRDYGMILDGYEVIEYWNKDICDDWLSIRIQNDPIDEEDTKQRLRLRAASGCKELKEYFQMIRKYFIEPNNGQKNKQNKAGVDKF